MATLPNPIGYGQAPRPSTGVASYSIDRNNAPQILEQAGAEAERASQIINETNRKQDEIAAQAALNELKKRSLLLEQDPEKGFSAAKGGAVVGQKFVSGYQEQFDTAAESISSALTSDYQKRIFNQHKDIVGLQYQSALLQHQAKETTSFNKQTREDTVAVAVNDIIAHPYDDAVKQTNMLAVDAAITASGKDAGLSGEDLSRFVQDKRAGVEKHIKKELDNISYESASLMLEQGQDPRKSPAWDKMDDGHKAIMLGRIHADDSRKAAEGKYDILQRTKDVQAMVLSAVPVPDGTAPTVQEYIKAHGPSGAAAWQQEVGNYIAISDVMQKMRSASAAERESMLASAKPEAGPGFAGGLHMQSAVAQAKNLIERQLIADPQAYAMQNSPRLQKAAAAMQQVLSDPNQPAEDRTAVVDFYASVSNAEQLRLGVDTIRDDRTGNKLRGPKLLTNAQANAISDQFHDQSSGGAKAADLVTSLEQQYGKWWPQVYSQLAADTKLPPAALVIPNMQSDGSRARLAAASVMKMDELKASLQPTDPKDVRDQVLQEFGDAQSSFVAQGADGNRTLALVIGEAEKLALMYRSQGRSVKEAAKQAYTETMGWRYDFEDTYRIPNDQAPKDVRRGAGRAVRYLKPEGLKVFAGGAPQIITDDALRTRTIWLTDGEEKGLQLMLRGQDGGIYAVQDKAGQPIRYDWTALRSLGTAPLTPEQEQAEHTDWMRRRQQELNPVRH